MMDYSADPNKSCSSDDNINSSVFSAISESLNSHAPLSKNKSIKNNTSRIKERCEWPIATPISDHGTEESHTLSVTDVKTSHSNKPSYLNLACCVNGYSNLTTYDSKIRQDINNSREVSPIIPGTNLQFCKKYIFDNPDTSRLQNVCSQRFFSQSYKESLSSNSKHENETPKASKDQTPEILRQSFIQQRVERLYGKSAQQLFTPKNIKLQISCSSRRGNSSQKLFKKVHDVLETGTVPNSLTDLPVLRHLSEEFRAQLSTISVKKDDKKTAITDYIKVNRSEIENEGNSARDDVNLTGHLLDFSTSNSSDLLNSQFCEENKNFFTVVVSCVGLLSTDKQNMESQKNGTFFLNVLTVEQDRLLSLSFETEKYINTLTKSSEEVLGFLRSAAGKARLLVSQKMKQFEGLCHTNLNWSPEDAFPTTVEDLQGFWDMVYLQIQQIDTIFYEIEVLKANSWQMHEMEMTAYVTMDTKYSVSKTRVRKENDKTLVAKPKEQSSSGQIREAQRNQLKELKRRNKLAMLSSSQSTKSGTNNIFLSSNGS